MINIENKQNCCGCNACVQVCPKHCITMREDHEGFLYPEVNLDTCVKCHLCEEVCPVINQGEERKPREVYAAKNRDEEIRWQSSSGGVFFLLAEQVLEREGVVFGAKFDENWEVVHSYTETKEGLVAFRGSKYVQSRIGDSFKKTEQFLKADRKVLFSGTPCQIAGLKHFLRKEYDNLLTVDFICHGVPSPGVWREYLKEETARQCGGKNSVLSHPNLNGRDACIESISFRDKRLGWKKFSFALTLSVPIGHGAKDTVLLSEPLNKNIFLRGFLADLYLRPSCHVCPSKCLKSGSDLTIGDFWGIKRVFPDFDDDKGVSVLMINTDKGNISPLVSFMEVKTISYETVCRSNSSLLYSSKLTENRRHFFSSANLSLSERVEELGWRKKNIFKRIINKVCHFVKL